MIIADTNVISELLKPDPSASVLLWVETLANSPVYTTATVLAEIHFGLAIAPAGKRRTLLQRGIRSIEDKFFGRILAFDEEAARHFGVIMGHCRRIGKSIDDFDGQIAAVASAHAGTLATRNTKHFVDCGVKLVNPWSYSN